MKLALEFVELHSSLFLAGSNMGVKLYSDPKKSRFNIQLYYDTELKHTVVIYQNKVALIESTASKTLADPAQLGIQITATKSDPIPVWSPETKAQIGGPERFAPSAQVSTPMDKVQGKPGKKAKFQGEEAE